jgi:hypothetical protein
MMLCLLLRLPLAAPSPCTFCGVDTMGRSRSFDLSSLDVDSTYILRYSSLDNAREFYVTSPCGTANAPYLCYPPSSDPVVRSWLDHNGDCWGLGTLANASVQVHSYVRTTHTQRTSMRLVHA